MRRKLNKADEFYIKTNRNMDPSEIAKELNLSEKAIRDFVSTLPPATKSVVKNARLKSKGKTIGVQLTEELSEPYEYKKPDPMSGDHIFRFKKEDD